MRRFIRFSFLILTISIAAAVFAGCGKEHDLTSIKLDSSKKYYISSKEILRFDPPDSDHHIVQGGYFDGKYFYVAFIKDDNPDSGVILEKFDINGKVKKVSKPLPLDHANNITFNSEKNSLVVSHCQSNEGDKYAHCSFVNPSNFKITETKQLEHPFFSMAYSPERNMYASGEWGGELIDIWDGDLNVADTFFEEPHSKTTSQGVWCDNDGIWFVRSGRSDSFPEIIVYGWDGNMLFNLNIEDINVEPESINFADGVCYIICNNESVNGGIIYTLEFHEYGSK